MLSLKQPVEHYLDMHGMLLEPVRKNRQYKFEYNARTSDAENEMCWKKVFSF